jgi:hypothetical protein
MPLSVKSIALSALEIERSGARREANRDGEIN